MFAVIIYNIDFFCRTISYWTFSRSRAESTVARLPQASARIPSAAVRSDTIAFLEFRRDADDSFEF